MTIIPKARGERIAWYKSHLAKWEADPGGIGTTSEQVAALRAAIEAAEAKREQRVALQQAAMAATASYNAAVQNVSDTGSKIMQQIRAKAANAEAGEASGGAEIYEAAMVPAPRKASPLAAPGQPYDLNFTLDAIGQITLRWKCRQPRNAVGTLYHVSRQLDGAGPFRYVGRAGKKTFTDDSLPAGSKSAIYRVQGMRGRTEGPVANLIVMFGGAGGQGVAAARPSQDDPGNAIAVVVRAAAAA